MELYENGFDVRVSLLVSSVSADYLESLITRMVQSQIRIGLMPQLMATEAGSLHPLDLAADDSQLMRLFAYEGDWNSDPFEPNLGSSSESDYRACNAGRTTVGVRADGSILPCLVLTRPVLGHLSTDTLASVITGEARRHFLESNVTPDICRACDLRRFCMRCPADALAETGSLSGIPPESCRIARLRAKFHIDSQR